MNTSLWLKFGGGFMVFAGLIALAWLIGDWLGKRKRRNAKGRKPLLKTIGWAAVRAAADQHVVERNNQLVADVMARDSVIAGLRGAQRANTAALQEAERQRANTAALQEAERLRLAAAREAARRLEQAKELGAQRAADLERQLVDAELQAQALQREAADDAVELERAASALATAQTERQVLAARVAELEAAEPARLGQQLEDKTATIERLEKQAEAYRREIGHLEAQLAARSGQPTLRDRLRIDRQTPWSSR